VAVSVLGSFAALVGALEAGSLALEGHVAGGLVGTASLGAGAAAALCLVELRASRPEAAGRRRGRTLLPTPGGARALTLVSAVTLLWRSRELRLALVAASVFGVAGVAAGAATGAPTAAGTLLGGGACAIASCFVPLSVRGRVDAGLWLWRLTRRALVATAWASAALALVLAALLPVHLLAVAGGGDGAAAAAQVTGLAVLAWASALAAGSLVPRRSTGAGDDALSLGVFSVVTVTLGGAVALAGERLDTAGLPGAVAAGVALLAASLASVVLLALSLERGRC
jgi:hypothetical protein